MRKTVSIDIFCDRQAHLFLRLNKIGITKLIDCGHAYDEITNYLICQRVIVSIPSWFEGILDWLVMHHIDPEGQDRIDRLIKRGLVS